MFRHAALCLCLVSLQPMACSVVLDSLPRTLDGDADDVGPEAADLDGASDADAPDRDLDGEAEEDPEIPPNCGNGTLDDDEDCDDGNDVDGDGCDTDCTYSCTEATAAEDCDDRQGCTDDACNPDTHQCTHSLVMEGIECRPQRAQCDTAELCDGTSPECPADVQACWAMVDAGRDWACALSTDGGLFCWGSNGYSQLGDDSFTDRPVPTPIGDFASAWSDVGCAYKHTCGIAAPGELYCWGNNVTGQLGDGTTSSKRSPNRVGALSDWSQVSGNGHLNSEDLDLQFTCAVRTTGELYCWGGNGHGQLGIGNYEDQYIPTQVGEDTDWHRVSAGGRHTCALKTDGRLFCWGLNSSGQLGLGTTGSDRNSPVQVGTDMDWSGLSLGSDHTCALKSGGDLFCWGGNWEGQLGDGSLDRKDEPVFIGPGWSHVGAGPVHTCAVKADGALYCWGYNTYSQCGSELPSPITGPTPVGTDRDWATVEGGRHFTCGLKSNSDLFCWGRNESGQIGNGEIDPDLDVSSPSVVLRVE